MKEKLLHFYKSKKSTLLVMFIMCLALIANDYGKTRKYELILDIVDSIGDSYLENNISNYRIYTQLSYQLKNVPIKAAESLELLKNYEKKSLLEKLKNDDLSPSKRASVESALNYNPEPYEERAYSESDVGVSNQ